MFKERKRFLQKNKSKLTILFVSVFCITCLNLCAEEITVAQAKKYRENLITEAKKYIGCPYVYGAVGPDSFDCSGLVYHVAREANKTQLPRTTKALYNFVKIIPDKQKEPGDLVFFKTTSSGTVSHVGIYIGNNQFISAVSDGPNTGVILSSLNEGYWNPKYIGVGRIYKSTKTTEDDFVEEPFVDDEELNTASSKNNSNSSTSYKETKGTDYIVGKFCFEGDASFNWALFRPNTFCFDFRGIGAEGGIRYIGRIFSPGATVGVRYNAGLNVLQIPITLSLEIFNFLTFSIGPIFTLGNPYMSGAGKIISQAIFPGFISLSFSTPKFSVGGTVLQFVQNIDFAFCAGEDGNKLTFQDAVTTGLVFFTGIRILVPI